jgi:hypothetical protein
MNNFRTNISFYIQKYPARISGYVSAIVLNTSIYFKGFPTGLLIPTAMLLILLGEGSQRMEDKKTVEALYVENDPQKSDEQILIEMLKKVHGNEHIDKEHGNGYVPGAS